MKNKIESKKKLGHLRFERIKQIRQEIWTNYARWVKKT